MPYKDSAQVFGPGLFFDGPANAVIHIDFLAIRDGEYGPYRSWLRTSLLAPGISVSKECRAQLSYGHDSGCFAPTLPQLLG